MILNGTAQVDFPPMSFSQTLRTERPKSTIITNDTKTHSLLWEHKESAPLGGRDWVIKRNNCIMLTRKTICLTQQSIDKIHTHCTKTLNVELQKAITILWSTATQPQS